MKKIVSILMTLALILCLSTTVFANGSTNVTIADSTGKTYSGFMLLDLTTSLKADAHHTAHEGDHTDDCYNFAYVVNEKYRTILRAEVFANGGNYLWEGTYKPADASGITDDQIMKYLENQTSGNDGTLRQVADRVYRAILAAGLTADQTITGSSASFEQGYWMIADVTDLSDKNEANSLVMVDTKGEADLTITPKTALPTIEKRVKDIEDSEDATIVDNAWHIAADHDIGDNAIPFKLTATLPSNAQYYQSYKIVFHDTMDSTLVFNKDSVKVLMYETKYKADVDTDLNDAVMDVTDIFTVNTATTDGCTFEVSCDNVYTIEGVTKDTTFVVYYEAALGDDAVIGAAGNVNSAALEFSNDPYSTSTGIIESNDVVVYTYQLVINKTDSHGHELEGAGFTLSKKSVDGAYTAIGTELKGENMTTFTWVGLDDGDYLLEETTVPEGYNKMDDIHFSISAVHTENGTVATLESLDGGLMGMGDAATGIIEKDIENHTSTVLPETGAEGTFFLITAGTLLVVVACVFMITRKKMSIYED